MRFIGNLSSKWRVGLQEMVLLKATNGFRHYFQTDPYKLPTFRFEFLIQFRTIQEFRE